MRQDDIVWQNRNRVSGALCFKGTRVPVKVLMDHLKHGYTIADFLEGFPGVSREQAEAFLDLAHDQVEASTVAEEKNSSRADARPA